MPTYEIQQRDPEDVGCFLFLLFLGVCTVLSFGWALIIWATAMLLTNIRVVRIDRKKNDDEESL